jgi:hypothetical protein
MGRMKTEHNPSTKLEDGSRWRNCDILSCDVFPSTAYIILLCCLVSKEEEDDVFLLFILPILALVKYTRTLLNSPISQYFCCYYHLNRPSLSRLSLSLLSLLLRIEPNDIYLWLISYPFLIAASFYVLY